MSKSSKVEGGGTTAVAAPIRSADASAEVSLVEEGGGSTTLEDSTLGRLELLSSEQPST